MCAKLEMMQNEQEKKKGNEEEQLNALVREHVEQLEVLVWNSPRREGVLPAGDERGNWNVTWFPADV
jgi:hypothetical protein